MSHPAHHHRHHAHPHGHSHAPRADAGASALLASSALRILCAGAVIAAIWTAALLVIG